MHYQEAKLRRARKLRRTAAAVIAGVGVVGLAVPVLPGIPLLVAAGVIWASKLPIERRLARG